MEFDHLRTFLSVVEHGSFSRAADALHVTQPTVSFQIRALEESVGARLLDRGRPRVRPTAAGQALRAYAERLLALRREAQGQVRAGEALDAGELRLVASTIPGEYLLPALLARMKRAHPGVAVALAVTDSEQATDAVRARRADLGAVGSRVVDSRLVFAPLGDDEIVLCAAPSLGLRRVEPRDLGATPLVVRERGSGTRAAVARLLARHRVNLADLRPALELGSTEAVKRTVLAGCGAAFLSRLAVADDLRAGRLVEVAMTGLPLARRFFWVRRRGATLPPAARRLIEISDGLHRGR